MEIFHTIKQHGHANSQMLRMKPTYKATQVIKNVFLVHVVFLYESEGYYRNIGLGTCEMWP